MNRKSTGRGNGLPAIGDAEGSHAERPDPYAATMPDKSLPGVRLAELVASLSLATDLGLGQPQEHVLRQTVIAKRLAAIAGFAEDEQVAAFYVSLLAMVGCVGDSHELSRWFGDDTRVRAASFEVN